MLVPIEYHASLASANNVETDESLNTWITAFAGVSLFRVPAPDELAPHRMVNVVEDDLVDPSSPVAVSVPVPAPCELEDVLRNCNEPPDVKTLLAPVPLLPPPM